MLAILLFTYIALLFMITGASILDTYVFFPNWFHNMPSSIVTARDFYAYRNPGAFFIPMLLLVLISGAGFVAAAWKTEPARIWILVAVVLFAAIGVLNVGFIYPRIGFMMANASVPEQVGEIIRTAMEFQVLIQVRMVILLICIALSVFALWRFYVNAPKIEVITPADIEPENG
jgi:hypothetical protein